MVIIIIIIIIMQVYCDELAQQSEQAQMNINSCKTKEMLIGSISKDPPATTTCFVLRWLTRLIE